MRDMIGKTISISGMKVGALVDLGDSEPALSVINNRPLAKSFNSAGTNRAQPFSRSAVQPIMARGTFGLAFNECSTYPRHNRSIDL